jgi:hypothetical protein
MKLTLHCGAPKCGSSALQSVLTHEPVLRSRSGARVVYGVLDRTRGLIAGQDLLRDGKGPRARRTSMDANRFDSLDVSQVRDALHRIAADELILSCEGWFSQSRFFDALLRGLNVPVRVVAYVRPQVAWMNSAWWQWGAWGTHSFDRAIGARLRLVQWNGFAADWEAVPQVEQVIVRLLPKDVVQDFYEEVLHVPVPVLEAGTGEVNRSLPGSLLRLFQRHRELRPGPHDSEIEYVLGKTPWVLDETVVGKILEASHAGNLALLDRLPPEQAVQMRADPRWWEVAAYGDKPLEPPGPVDIPREALEEMCVGLIKALAEQARDHRGAAANDWTRRAAKRTG